MFPSIRTVLRVDGLGTFGQRVLFARVRPESADRFAALLEAVRARLAAASAAVAVSDKFDFTPHLTLCKVRTKDIDSVLSVKMPCTYREPLKNPSQVL